MPPTEIWSFPSSFAGKVGADGASAAMGGGVASDTAMVGISRGVVVYGGRERFFWGSLDVKI